MFLIAGYMVKDVVRALKTGEYDLAHDVSQRDDEDDWQYLLTSKQFRSILCGGKFPTPLDIYRETSRFQNGGKSSGGDSGPCEKIAAVAP
jgi:hypothetical protein